jgi:hypothetical protein
MKYLLIVTVLFVAVAIADDNATAVVEEQQTKDYTKEQLADAKRAKEKFLDALRDEIALRQNRLSRSRAAIDSEERKELKASVAEKKDEFAVALKQPVSHWLKQAEIDKEIQEKDAAKAVEEARKAREQAEAASREIKKNRPLSIDALGLHSNVINLPQLVVVTKNNTDRPIEAYTVSAECFNKFDEPVNDLAGNNVYRGISQSTIQAGQKDKGVWQMSLHRNTAYARVWITRVKFSDGTEWHQTKQEAMDRGQAFFRVELD